MLSPRVSSPRPGSPSRRNRHRAVLSLNLEQLPLYPGTVVVEEGLKPQTIPSEVDVIGAEYSPLRDTLQITVAGGPDAGLFRLARGQAPPEVDLVLTDPLTMDDARLMRYLRTPGGRHLREVAVRVLRLMVLDDLVETVPAPALPSLERQLLGPVPSGSLGPAPRG